MQEKDVTLDPGESQEVAFTFTPLVAKTHYVSVNGLTGSFVAIALPAEFVVTNLIITPSQVYVGEPVTIRALVTNIGGETGTKTVTLEVS